MMNPAGNVIGSKQGLGWNPLTGVNVKGMPLGIAGLLGEVGGQGGNPLMAMLGGMKPPAQAGQKPQDKDSPPGFTPSIPMPGVPGSSDSDTFSQATKMLTQNPSLSQAISGGVAPGAGAMGGAGLGTGAGGALGNALASTAGSGAAGAGAAGAAGSGAAGAAGGAGAAGAAGALGAAMPWVAAYEMLKANKQPNQMHSGGGYSVG